MSTGHSDHNPAPRLALHPSVGMSVDPASMTPRQKVAAVAKVRALEHALFEGERVRRRLGPEEIDDLVGSINELRSALGWLEITLDGALRWPHSVPDGSRLEPGVAGR